jgi:hypothetical protein
MRTNQEIDAFLDGKTEDAPDEIDAFLDGKEASEQESTGYAGAVWRGVAQGALGLAGGAGSAVKWLGDVSAGPYVAKAGEKLSKSMGELSQEVAPKGPDFEGTFVENPSVKRALHLIGTAASFLGAAMATGMAATPLLGPTGGAIAGAGLLGTTEGAPYYEEARKAGKSVGDASKIGAATTFGTTLLEFLPISRFLKGIKGGIVVRGLKGGTMESTQEMSQQLWQNLVKKYGYDKTQGLAEGIVESGIAAFGTGAPVGVMFKEYDAADVKKAKDDIDKQVVALADKISEDAKVEDGDADAFLDGATDKDPRQVALEKAWAKYVAESEAEEEQALAVEDEQKKPTDQQAREANQRIIDATNVATENEIKATRKVKEDYSKAQAQVVGDMLAKGDIDVQVASKRLKQIEKENKKWQKETAEQPAEKATSPVADQTKKATEAVVSPKKVEAPQRRDVDKVPLDQIEDEIGLSEAEIERLDREDPSPDKYSDTPYRKLFHIERIKTLKKRKEKIEETPKADQPEGPAQPPVQAKTPEATEAVDRRQATRNTKGILSGKGKNGKQMKPAPKGKNVKGIVVDKTPTIQQIHTAVIRDAKDLPKLIKAYGPNFKKDYAKHVTDLYGEKGAKGYVEKVGKSAQMGLGLEVEDKSQPSLFGKKKLSTKTEGTVLDYLKELKNKKISPLHWQKVEFDYSWWKDKKSHPQRFRFDPKTETFEKRTGGKGSPVAWIKVGKKEHDTLINDERVLDEISEPILLSTQKGTGITPQQVVDSFKAKGFNAVEIDDETVGLNLSGRRNGRLLFVRVLDQVVDSDETAIEVGYGRKAKSGEVVAGSYLFDEKFDTILLKRNLADPYTLEHELFHHMKKAGLFNPAEEKILARKGDEEAQARWVESNLRKRAGLSKASARLIQKVRDFIDALVNSFVRTERGLLRDIEKGNVLKRTKGSPNGTKGGIKLAAKKITDSPAFKKWFGKSKVVDENGEPLVVYHGAVPTGEIKTFYPFSHFGTADAAEERLRAHRGDPDEYGNPSVDGEMVFPVYLSIKNPIRFEDSGAEDAMADLLGAAVEQKIISVDERDYAWGTYESEPDIDKAFDEIASLLESKGYDGGVYSNALEDAGFDSWIAFRPTQIKSATGNRGTFDPNNPDIRYSTLVDGFAYSPATMIDRAKESINPFLREFMHWVVDKNHSIQTIQNRLGKVTEDINLFLKETGRPKRTAAWIQRVWDDEVHPLITKMSKYKIKQDELNRYSHAMHVIGDNLNQDLLERNAKLRVEELIGALPKKDAKAVTEGTKGLKTPKEWFDALENILEEHGDKEDVQLISEKWKDKSGWRPLSGLSDDEAKAILKKYSGNKKIEELRKMLSSMNNNRLETIFNAGLLPKETYDEIKKKYKYYVPLMREGYDDKLFGVPRGLNPTGKQIKVRGGSTREVVNIFANSVANYERAIGAAEKAYSQKALYGLIRANPGNGVLTLSPVPKSKRFDSDGNLSMYPDMGEVQKNEMRIMVGGKMYLITAENKTDRDAMLMMKTLKADEHSTGPIVNFLAKINRILARINTTWSPEFIVSNFVRDIQTAGINIQDTGVKGEKMFSGAKNAIQAIWAVERGKRKGTELEAMYDRFKKAGGKIGWSDVHGSIENLAKKISREIKMQSGKAPARATVKKWLDLVEDANTSIENGVRLHTFKLATEQGFSDERAAAIASDLTVDFTKKGAAGPAINSLYLFANAGIQGSYRILRAATKSKQVKKTLAGIVGVSFVVGLLNSMAGEDDDGEDYYNKIDDFVRERNMIFMIPGTKGKYVKIPAPWGYNLFWNIGSELSRAVTKENYSAMAGVGRLISVAAGAFNPVQSGTLLQTLSPTVADPFVQVSENKNWFGGDLMPAVNKFEKIPTPDSQRYWKSASVGSKWVAQALNSMTGGDKVKSGVIDVSPETLDLILDTAGGSALRFFKDTFGVPLKAIRGEELQMHKIPFARRVAGEQPEWANSRIYYDNVERVMIAKERVETYKGTDQYKSVLAATKTERKLIQAAERSEKHLRRLRKTLKVAEARNDKDRVKKIKDRMNKIYNQFNKKCNEEN